MWSVFAMFTLFALFGPPLGTPIYFFQEVSDIKIYPSDFLVGIMFIVAVEFSSRKMKKIGKTEVEISDLLENDLVFKNKYSNSTKEYIDLATQPMNIVSD